MLVFHCTLETPMAHCLHHSGQVAGCVQYSRSVIMSAAVKNQVCGKASRFARIAKTTCDRCKVPRLRARRPEDPARLPVATPSGENFQNSLAHRYESNTS